MQQARSGGGGGGRTPNAAYSGGGGGRTQRETVRYVNEGAENPEANTTFID